MLKILEASPRRVDATSIPLSGDIVGFGYITVEPFWQH